MARHGPYGIQERESTSGFHSQLAIQCDSLVRAYRLAIRFYRLTCPSYSSLVPSGLPGYPSHSPSLVSYPLVDSERLLLDYQLGAS